MSCSEKLSTLFNLETLWRSETINLNASENYTSASVKKMLCHPSYDFYPFPPSGGEIDGPWRFSKPSYLQEMDAYINELGQELLDCEALDVRPKGGQAAEIAVLMALAKAGDSVFYVQEKDGGHFGLNLISEKIGIKLLPILFNDVTHEINIKQTMNSMREVWKNNNSQKLVMIGQSFILRKQPLREFSEKVKNEFSNILIFCDVSHVLGLIVGKQYTNPISEGADLIHGSTHKTFPGPMKGIIGFPSGLDKKIRETIQNTVSPGIQSNSGTAEILALALALEEMKIYGEDYAKKVCSHAKYFAQLLDGYGFDIVGKDFGFTETHQIWLAMDGEEQAWQAFGDLHRAGIRIYASYLPFIKKWGLRFSTAAATRLGFELEDIKELGGFVKDVLTDRNCIDKTRNSIRGLMRKFDLTKVKYGFS